MYLTILFQNKTYQYNLHILFYFLDEIFRGANPSIDSKQGGRRIYMYAGSSQSNIYFVLHGRQ